MEIQCRNLQRSGCPRLRDVATMLERHGLLTWIKGQILVAKAMREERLWDEGPMKMFDCTENVLDWSEVGNEKSTAVQ
jgi:hypothetical protein